MHFKDATNTLYWLDDAKDIHYLPNGVVEITDEEAEQIRLASIPQPTIADLAEAVRLSLQSAIDEKAKEFGFMSGGNALMLYAGFANPFQPLAQTFATWEASVWYEAELYKAEVIAGTKPMLSPSEAIALMPEYPE